MNCQSLPPIIQGAVFPLLLESETTLAGITFRASLRVSLDTESESLALLTPGQGISLASDQMSLTLTLSATHTDQPPGQYYLVLEATYPGGEADQSTLAITIKPDLV